MSVCDTVRWRSREGAAILPPPATHHVGLVVDLLLLTLVVLELPGHVLGGDVRVGRGHVGAQCEGHHLGIDEPPATFRQPPGHREGPEAGEQLLSQLVPGRGETTMSHWLPC